MESFGLFSPALSFSSLLFDQAEIKENFLTKKNFATRIAYATHVEKNYCSIHMQKKTYRNSNENNNGKSNKVIEQILKLCAITDSCIQYSITNSQTYFALCNSIIQSFYARMISIVYILFLYIYVNSVAHTNIQNFVELLSSLSILCWCVRVVFAWNINTKYSLLAFFNAFSFLPLISQYILILSPSYE